MNEQDEDMELGNAVISPEVLEEINKEMDGIAYVNKERHAQIFGKGNMIMDDIKKKTIEIRPNKDHGLGIEAPIEIPQFGWPIKDSTVEGKIVGTPGQYYKEVAYDPTVSEAFDAGMYTCLLLLREGLIELDKEIPDDNDS